MKLNEANIRFRSRTTWEAMDLGVRMVAPYRLKLFFLYLLTSLPFSIAISVLYWDDPSWAAFLIWWIKPIFEYVVLYVLSISVFESPPSFKTCLKQSFRLIFSLRTIVDLTWRRFSPYRSINLPIRQLENLKGSAYRTRATLINHQGSNAGPLLTWVGANIEAILFGGVAAFIWFAVNVDATGAFQQDYASLFRGVAAFFQSMSQSSPNYLWWGHINNFIYLIILAFWGPIYVSCGFSVYLNARGKLEAWDVELTFRRLAQRLGQIFTAIFLVFVFWHSAVPVSYAAEALPKEKEVVLQRDKIVNNEPYQKLNRGNKWCFFSCNKAGKHRTSDRSTERGQMPAGDSLFGNGIRIILWIGLAAVLVMVVYFLFRDPYWLQSLTKKHKTAPKVMFGMDVTPESLPDDVATEAFKLFKQDERAALSLLYRASLTQLIYQYDVALRNGHTESEILHAVTRSAPSVFGYMEFLTHHWVAMAYGHISPDEEIRTKLCQDYRKNFPEALPKQDLSKGVKHA